MGKRRANGEGSIRKRDDDSWEARILINGKSRSIYGRTQSDVRKKLTEVRNDLDNDEYLEPNDTTLKEWLELWQDEYLEDVKQSTADRYKSCIRIHIIPALGETRLMDLRASTIQKFLNQCITVHRRVYKILAQTVESMEVIYVNNPTFFLKDSDIIILNQLYHV